MKDIDKDTLGEALARNTLDDIPQPKSDAREIVGLVKSSGRIISFPTEQPFPKRKASPSQKTAK